MNYLKSNIFQVFYLSLLPLTLFSGIKIQLLATSFIAGVLLYRLFKKPSFPVLGLLLILISVVVFLERPRLGLDLGYLNVINSQRGEHPGFQTELLPKLIHNKIELSHSFIENIDSLISPKAIFASGFWHNLSKYYPLGYLFPWDIYFIYAYLKKSKKFSSLKNFTYFGLALLILVLLSGLLYIDFALTFSFSIIYFLAVLASIGYSKSSTNTKIIFAILNIIYLVYQWNVIPFFRS